MQSQAYSPILLKGAVAGFIATAPMTVVMEALYRYLPKELRYYLPPKLITTQIVGLLRLNQKLSSQQRDALTLFSHFTYGSLAGAFGSLLLAKQSKQLMTKGISLGMLVWAASYVVWLPAVGLMPAIYRQPKERVLLAVLSHLVWGLATVGITSLLQKQNEKSQLELKEHHSVVQAQQELLASQ